jgi:phosphoglycerate dehydrogenase-like enzyme
MALKVLINRDIPDKDVERIREAFPEISVVLATDRGQMLAEAVDADIILGGLNRPVFEAAEDLKWVQTISAGVDGLLFPELVRSEVILTSGKGLAGKPLAEHAWGFILALTRKIGLFMGESSWDRRNELRDTATELGGKVLGIIGLGGAGTGVAQRSQGWEMRVLAVDPEVVDRPPFIDQLWEPSRLSDLLVQSDVVVICCPLTEDTEGMIGADQLEIMKDTALLVNVTRGGVIDQSALVMALHEGQIAGAGLDAFEIEPLSPDSPLWKMDNVVMTPHIAGASDRRLDRVIDRFLRNLGRFMQGRPLEGVIDKRKGY